MGGFFVEAGAFDGEARSNSFFFERERGWTGLLFEANPQLFQQKTTTCILCRGVWHF